MSAPAPAAERGLRGALDDGLMLRTMPGVYCAGEMLDWEAPTGGYLLTACFATGRWAGQAAARRALSDQSPSSARTRLNASRARIDLA